MKAGVYLSRQACTCPETLPAQFLDSADVYYPIVEVLHEGRHVTCPETLPAQFLDSADVHYPIVSISYSGGAP